MLSSSTKEGSLNEESQFEILDESSFEETEQQGHEGKASTSSSNHPNQKPNREKTWLFPFRIRLGIFVAFPFSLFGAFPWFHLVTISTTSSCEAWL